MSSVILPRKQLIEEIESALQRLNVSQDSSVKLDVTGNMLIVTPIRDEKRAADFRAAVDKVKSRYSEALRNLAK